MSEEKEVVPPPAVVDGEEGENAEEDKPTLEAPEPITVQYCPGGKQQRVCACVCVCQGVTLTIEQKRCHTLLHSHTHSFTHSLHSLTQTLTPFTPSLTHTHSWLGFVWL